MSRNYHTDNKSFMVYKDWEEYVNLLETDEDVGMLFKALFAYAKRGEEPDFNGALKMAFAMMRNFIELDGVKWEETCERNSANGKLGGRPPKRKKADGSDENPKVPKKPDTDKDTDTVTDTDTGKDKEKDTEFVLQPDGCSPPPPKTNTIKTFGEYGHITMSDEEYKKLVEQHGEATVDEYIKKVDEYCQQNGRTYCDYALTIKKWIVKDVLEKPEKPVPKKNSYDLKEWERSALTFNPLEYGRLHKKK